MKEEKSPLLGHIESIEATDETAVDDNEAEQSP